MNKSGKSNSFNYAFCLSPATSEPGAGTPKEVNQIKLLYAHFSSESKTWFKLSSSTDHR